MLFPFNLPQNIASRISGAAYTKDDFSFCRSVQAGEFSSVIEHMSLMTDMGVKRAALSGVLHFSTC